MSYLLCLIAMNNPCKKPYQEAKRFGTTLLAVLLANMALYQFIPAETAPKEDRGCCHWRAP